MAEVLGIDHVSVLVQDAKASCAFYQAVLGLELVERPALGFEGYWLALGNGQTLHLMQLPNPDPIEGRPEHGGRDRHFALHVKDLTPFVSRLQQMGRVYSLSKSGRSALFFKDLDQNAIELYQPPSH